MRRSPWRTFIHTHMIRSFLLAPALFFALSSTAQVMPASGTSPATKSEIRADFDQPRGNADHNRYGFHAVFEVRYAPGVIKVLEVRQYFLTEMQSVQGFMRVRSSVPAGAILKSLDWVTPTGGFGSVGG